MMKSQPNKEIERTVTHKGTMDLQKIERERRGCKVGKKEEKEL